MAFKRTLTRGISSALTDAHIFIGPTSDVVIGLRITNITAAPIKVAACITNGANDTYLVGGPTVATMGADVPVGASIVVINGDIDKVVLETGDKIRVASSAASSADVVVSALAQ